MAAVVWLNLQERACLQPHDVLVMRDADGGYSVTGLTNNGGRWVTVTLSRQVSDCPSAVRQAEQRVNRQSDGVVYVSPDAETPRSS